MQPARDLVGLRALVVGGTAGIGLGVAKHLTERGATVTIAGRSQRDALEQGAAAKFMAVDASSLRDVRRLAAEYVASEPGPLDVLVLSAGIATLDGFTPTAEGLDVKLALHYFARVALVEALAPALAASPRGRVMFVLSAGVHSPHTAPADFELRDTYTLKAAADAAGWYTDCAVMALARAHPTLRVVHASPGLVATNWGSEFNPVLRGLVRVVQWAAFASPEKCARQLGTVLLGAEPGAWYADRDKLIAPQPQMTDAEVARVFAATKESLRRGVD